MKLVNDGWAFKKDEAEGAKKSVTNAAEFALKYGGFVEVDKVEPGYANKLVSGHFTKELTLTNEEAQHLLSYLDDGNLCFGGTISFTKKGFVGKIYTD